ncbi:MAG: UDP-N-acetylenolpyruvoylglucosamine reductase [Candidatus Tagabacteria bacterium CG09_land_8_20_14_0_10_41_14]|uniref:UDP-N-acetylenolpyruvoylglucosamine reductase n=1 Tax=Candidatus Tagabacteria bacterium CG09_land_8_20_14_0_10_41_14 TaxID=1975021 RepID=A0A2H0WKW1_9BACT|nr:MAG: UDP-N-acetylenolpyruvoylglucosamine reductase [Candidatus Tagabacteria bacterium CG09_land_8_20_14_0_10_41_14]
MTMLFFMNSEFANLQENILLANHTTFRLGGPARYFVAVKNNEELVGAVKYAKANSWPFFILGGGSNLLVSDEGFNGLVIKMQSDGLSVVLRSEATKDQKEGDKLKIDCDAGVPFGRVIMETLKSGYSGAEWGFGIPGTIGGAICGNAGRLGQAMAQVVESVTALDDNLEVKNLSKNECEFGYRESRFKKTKEIIILAVLVFEKKKSAMIEAVLNEAKAVVKHSPPYPSAGCVFKNYVASSNNDPLLVGHHELAERVREGKLGVGWLIDQCGLKGRQIGGAKIWEGHANYIVNVGGAKAQDVLALIKLVKEGVRAKYRIELEEEIRRVGNF